MAFFEKVDEIVHCAECGEFYKAEIDKCPRCGGPVEQFPKVNI